MKTVLFANRTAPELAPLTESSCIALLSVGCKPLIVHTVESLAMAELTDVIVVVSPDADAVKTALGDGTRWGMHFEYVHAGIGESEERTVQRVKDRLGEKYLLVRGELLRTPIIAEFLGRSRSIGSRSIVATIGGIDAGIRQVIGPEPFSVGAVNGTDLRRGPERDETRIDFPDARLSLLESLAAFHRASLDIVGGRFEGLIMPGREVAPGVRVGRHTRIGGKAIHGAPVLIGSRCRISGNAELGGDVLVSDDVVIDRRAVIRSSVIMPNTYVGELVEVTNAIVAGDRLIHVDTGTIATVADSFLLANISRPRFGLGVIFRAILALASGRAWRSGNASAAAPADSGDGTAHQSSSRVRARSARRNEQSKPLAANGSGLGEPEPKRKTARAEGFSNSINKLALKI